MFNYRLTQFNKMVKSNDNLIRIKLSRTQFKNIRFSNKVFPRFCVSPQFVFDKEKESFYCYSTPTLLTLILFPMAYYLLILSLLCPGKKYFHRAKTIFELLNDTFKCVYYKDFGVLYSKYAEYCSFSMKEIEIETLQKNNLFEYCL